MRRRLPLLAAATPLAAAGLIAGTSIGQADTTPTSGSLTTVLHALTTSSTPTRTSGTTSTGGTTPSTLTGSASSQVVSAPPLQTCVSCTSGSAGQNSAQGNATALEILGTTVEGGGSSGNGSNSGALLAVPANPLLTASILDWASQTQAGSSQSQSTSRAAVADVALAGGQVATVTVLEGDSTARWAGSSQSATATGHSETNGAVVDLGQGALVLVLLHSDADSSGSGNAYVASINGNQILSSSQTGGGIPIAIPGVGTITLLAVNAAGGTASADVGTVSNLLGMQGTQGTLLGSSGSGATVHSGVQGVTATPRPSGGTPSAAASSGPSVPFTGVGLGLAGLVLVGGGGGLAAAGALSRRRRRSGSAAGR